MDLIDQSPQAQNSQKVRKEIRKERRLSNYHLSQTLTHLIIIILDQKDQKINHPANQILSPLIQRQHLTITAKILHPIKLNAQQRPNHPLNL